MVDAHSGEIVRSWNDIQFAARKSVWGIIGNRNTISSYQLISVEQASPWWNCRHRNLDERMEVRLVKWSVWYGWYTPDKLTEELLGLNIFMQTTYQRCYHLQSVMLTFYEARTVANTPRSLFHSIPHEQELKANNTS